MSTQATQTRAQFRTERENLHKLLEGLNDPISRSAYLGGRLSNSELIRRAYDNNSPLAVLLAISIMRMQELQYLIEQYSTKPKDRRSRPPLNVR